MWSDNPTVIVGGSCEYANAVSGGVAAPSATSPYVAARAYCAADAALYQQGATCGSCFRVSYDGSPATDPGRAGSVVVQIVDSGSAKTFDCQVAAFEAITGARTGVFPITYEPVPCDLDLSRGPVATVLDGNNAWYTKVIFSNLPQAAASAELKVNGDRFPMSRVSGATWKASPGGATGAAGFTVTLQDGSIVELSSCFDTWPVPTGSHCAAEASDDKDKVGTGEENETAKDDIEDGAEEALRKPRKAQGMAPRISANETAEDGDPMDQQMPTEAPQGEMPDQDARGDQTPPEVPNTGGAEKSGRLTMWSDNPAVIVGGSCEYANAVSGGLAAPSATSPYARTYCAADAALYQQGAACGSCFRVSYDGSPATDPGRAGSVVVQIVDSGSAKTFDCQVDAFEAITGARTGVFPITYEPVPCDLDVSRGPVAMVLYHNAWYTTVIFSNLPQAVASAELKVNGDRFSSGMMRDSGAATWTIASFRGATGFTLTLQDGSTVELSSCFDTWPVPTGPLHCAQERLQNSDGEGHGNDVPEPDLILDGDSVFLRAHTGKRLTVQGDRVHAEWEHRGAWQTLVVEREDGAGSVWPGDRIFLRTHTGKRISVQGASLHAKWGNKGAWEALTLEREVANIGPLQAGDVILLRAHTGKYVSVQGGAVHAKWDHSGSWQRFTVERAPSLE